MRTGHSVIALTACGVLGTMLLQAACTAQAAPGAPQAETNGHCSRSSKLWKRDARTACSWRRLRHRTRRSSHLYPWLRSARCRESGACHGGHPLRDRLVDQSIFTAMTLMMSADEARSRSTDSPKKYLPYFRLQDPDADQHITLTDILSHRSGLARTDLLWAGAS